jgi:hypothetical protein
MNATTTVGARERRQQQSTNPLTVGLFAIVILAICGGAAYLFSTGAATEVEDVEASVEAFLNAATAGDYPGAYTYLSQERQTSIDADRFGAALKSDPEYAGITALSRLDFNKTPTGLYQYEGRLTYNDGSEGTLNATLVSQDGAWKIDGIEIKR